MKRLFQLILLLFPLLLSEKIYAQLNPKFSATPTSGCAPLSVQFNSEEDGYTHNWDFGNGPVVNNGPSDPTRHYTVPGTYTVTHTIIGPGGPKSESKTITVFASPTVDFSASATTVCPGTTVTFTFTGSLGVTGTANYKWVFGNDATPNIASGTNMSTATATYNTPGTYNVTLEVTNNKDCYNSITKKLYITVKENPTINFTASQTDFCTDTASVTFTPVITGGAPGPYIHSWEFGGPGNPTSNLPSPTHTYPGPRPAQYTVKLTVQSSNGCSTSLTKNNYIKLHKPDASFTGPTEACVYTTVNFTNTSTPPGAGSTWNFGDGSGNQPGVHGSHIYTTAGTYPVKLETSIGGCLDTVTKTILIRAQPNPKIVTNPDSVCPAPQLVCYSTQPLMASYDWNIENENGISTHTTPSPCVLFGKNGCWPTLLRVVDSFGCKDTILHTLVIHELNIVSRINNKYTPYPGFADSGCVSFNAAFTVNIFKGDPALYPCSDTSRIYPYGIKKVKWKFGTGDSSISQHPVYTYTDSGYYKITVEVETNNGCIVRDSMRIKVGYKPIIDSLVASDTVICPRSAVFFTGHVRGYDTLLFWWDFGDFKTRTRVRDSTFTHLYFGGPPCIDSHTVKLVASHKGCVSDTFKKNKYIVMLPPCAEFEWDIDTCSKPLTVRFTNKSKGDSSWLWKFGDGNTSTTRNPIHTYATKGYYNVQLIVHNDSTNCYDTMTKRIFFGENAPDVIANKNTLCVGDSVDFWAYQTGDSSLAIFTWYIDSVQVAAHQDALTYIFTKPGLYTIMVTAYSLNTKCTDTVIKTDWITVGGPTAGFVTADSFVCNPATVQFTDTSYAGENTTISRRSWYFGTSANDTLTATGVNVSKVYATTGDFDVSLIITDNLGCKDTAYYPVYVHVLKPDALFSAPSPTCVGQEISFTNASVNSVKNFWLFGDGNTDTVLNPKHTYTTMGVFNAQLIVTDSLGCKDTSNLVPITTTKPIANFTMSDSMAVCAPLIVSFDGRSSQRQKKYEWHFDDGASPGTKNTHTVVYNDVKEYQVKLIVTDSLGCKDSITKPIQVLGYAGAFSYTPIEGCVPLTVDFSSKIKGNIPTIIWDFGDGNSLLGSYLQPQVTYTYTQPGRYLPRMIFNNGLGCKTSSDGLDTILVDAAIADFETGPACQYSMVEFINKSVGVISPLTVTNWTFDDGTFSALNNPKRKYGPPGKYPVKLYVKNANGCEDSIDKELTINVPIEVSAGGDTIICLTDSAQLFPTGGVSYLWSPGVTLSCTDCANPYAFPKVKTVYTVISTDINGCHDTGYAQVDIKTHVVSIVGNGGEICQGEVFDLNVSGARTYIWSPAANLDNYTSATPKASPWETTKYRVIAYEGSCIPDTSHVDLVVHPKPTVTVRGEQTIVAGTSADLLASGEYISRFLWSPAATLSCKDCSNPIASPFKTTTYTVKVFTKFDCVDSADVTITVLCDKSQLFIPNTFTPNGDGINDIFMVRGTGITTLQAFRVYNRWGQVMYERTNVPVNDKTYGWDGNFNGTQLPPDVYVWTVEAFCENGDLLKLKGDVTIIR